MSRLSFNSMTADRWSLAEVIDACAEHGIEWIGPWRHKLAELGVEEARKRIDDAGLRVSSLCRGGFFAADGAAEDNRRAVVEAAAPGDTIRLAAGRHAGPVVIDRTLSLIGEPGAVLSGPGTGSVVTVMAPDVRIRGLEITGSGTDLAAMDSAIQASAFVESEMTTISKCGAAPISPSASAMARSAEVVRAGSSL